METEEHRFILIHSLRALVSDEYVRVQSNLLDLIFNILRPPLRYIELVPASSEIICKVISPGIALKPS